MAMLCLTNQFKHIAESIYSLPAHSPSSLYLANVLFLKQVNLQHVLFTQVARGQIDFFGA